MSLEQTLVPSATYVPNFFAAKIQGVPIAAQGIANASTLVSIGTAAITSTSPTFTGSTIGVPITPTSTNSKILVTFNGQCTQSAGIGFLSFFRNGVRVDSSPNGLVSIGAITTMASYTFVDSPGTTSSVVYTAAGSTNGGGTLTINSSTAGCSMAAVEL